MTSQPHRAPAQFNQGAGDDQKIANMLTLYQTPATIRDMKQVFFYTGVNSTITNVNFWEVFYNNTNKFSTNAYDQYSKSVYFAPLGTTRTMDISAKINDLLDIRVPKDKYFIELNLVECTIEADTTGWTTIPDRVVPNSANPANIESTFNWGLVEELAGPVIPPRKVIDTTLLQATKLTAPQTLYARIRECSNGEPYNWAVTNSGQFSQDKSHQVVIRHSDIDISRLTLEFGHMAFVGVDDDYVRFLSDPLNQSGQSIQSTTLLSSRLRNPISRADVPVYMDYNQEYFNALDTLIQPTGLYDFGTLPDYYKGRFKYPLPNVGTGLSPQPFNEPANRPPFLRQGADTGVGAPYNLQGKPFFYNQQASKINFRFLVKIIHMF